MDDTGRLAGRGAYLCADGSCWRVALEKGTVQRALHAPLPDELKQQLAAGRSGMGESMLTGLGADGSVAVRAAATSGTIDMITKGEAIGQE